jgi:Zinc carboxypeptidase
MSVGELQVLADLACASVGSVRVLGPDAVGIEVQSSLEYGPEGSLETWVCGRVVGATSAVDVHVVNEHGNMRYLRPVASHDGRSWRHVDEFGLSVDDGRVGFTFSLPEPRSEYGVAFATWWPYAAADSQALVSELAELPFVSRDTVGRSVEGRSIDRLVISERSPSKTVVLSAGMHGAETSGLWGMEGALRYLSGPEGAELRRAVRWVVVPLINVDVQTNGLDRRTASGVNLFLDEEAADEPELVAMYACLAEARPDAYVDFHSWHWGTDGCFMPGWLAVGDALYERILLLRRSIEHHFPMGEQIFYDEAKTNWLTRVSAELRVPVIGPEITLARGTDGQWKTDVRAREDGAAIVRGVAEFVDV